MTQRMRSAGVVEVLEVVVCEGEGNGHPPGEIFREVTYYYGKDGALLAKNDPASDFVKRGEPDARTRQVLAVSAENDRLRREVARFTAGIQRAARMHRESYPVATRYLPIDVLLASLLPPEQRDGGDEADCARDEP